MRGDGVPVAIRWDPAYSPLTLWKLMGDRGKVSLCGDGSVAALLSGSTLHITADGVRETAWEPNRSH